MALIFTKFYRKYYLDYRFYLRIVLPSFLAIILFVALLLLYVLPSYERTIIHGKREMLRELTNVVWNTIDELQQEASKGKITLEQAQSEAIEIVKGMRYGKENKDYFWITDMWPNMIMHPYKPELDNTDLRHYKDPEGTLLFMEALNTVKEKKEGYINYIWQWKDDSTQLVTKLSFVKGYEKWNWIIGTGVYLVDIKKELSMLKSQLLRISFLIIAIISGLLFFTIRYSMRIERMKEESQKEIKKLNENLERKVEERTRKLSDAYKELESFAYNLSHNLRAPLRHIDGFLRILYTSINTPTEKTIEYYDKIKLTLKYASVLMDQLLLHSYLGRKELLLTPIDANLLVNDIIRVINHSHSELKVNWNIDQLPVIYADRSSINIAFGHVISNAVKFTSKSDNPVIEIGANEKEENIEFYIKDNGVGFNMSYIDKLFGVFQRLHSTDEFEGVGIGLAIVKLIIEKHGGTVRAESETGKGATFYLTLPK